MFKRKAVTIAGLKKSLKSEHLKATELINMVNTFTAERDCIITGTEEKHIKAVILNKNLKPSIVIYMIWYKSNIEVFTVVDDGIQARRLKVIACFLDATGQGIMLNWTENSEYIRNKRT